MKPTSPPNNNARNAAAWIWIAGVGLTALMIGAGWLGGWGPEPYRTTSLLLRILLAAFGAGMASLFWARRDAAAGAFAVLRARRPWWLFLPLLWVLFVLLRERRYIGDWINIAFALPSQPSWMLNDYIIWRAPLTNLLQYLHWRAILNPIAGRDLLYPWQVLLAFYGVLLVVAQWLVGKAAFRSRRTAILYITLYATSGILYFCLGHVENYVIPMAILAATAWLSLRAIHRRRGAPWAFGWFGAAVMAHPQCLIFAPSMLVVLFLCLPARRGAPISADRALYLLKCLAALLSIPLILVSVTLISGIGIDPRAVAGGDPRGTLLPAAQALSATRFNDLWMIMLRVFPALPFAFLAAVFWRRRLPASDFVGLWFALNAGPAFVFCLFIWNKAPMPVDWDLMGPSLMMLWMAFLYALLRSAPARRRIQIALCLAALQLPHTVVWLGWTTRPDPAQKEQIEILENAAEKARKAAPGYLQQPSVPPVGAAPNRNARLS